MENEDNLPPYKLVHCSFRDQLEAAAVLKKDCRLEILKDGNTVEVSGKIRDIFTLKGAEYLLMEEGPSIRLDLIVSFNGIPNNIS